MNSENQPAAIDNRPKKHWQLCHDIIEVFYAVYNELGHGFLEAVYEEAIVLALMEAGFTVARQVPLPIWFRGKRIGEYKADLIVNNAVLLELKAARALDSSHEAQSLNYLRATDIEVALLLNFGTKPHFKRFVFANERKRIRVHSR
ncbi:MAG TPA: GxxExxY protein [Candidatus Saccharimonadales bacterium]|jgi:GxxExxY protein|nr:GxxExxY protein [Candidatus Saccharimonadales bacterium]